MEMCEGSREIDIAELERAINRCRHALAAGEGTLARELSLMATLYGLMIYQHERSAFVPDAQELLRKALATWAGDAPIAAESVTGEKPC